MRGDSTARAWIIALLVVLVTLTPLTSWAECAWVLWEHVWYTGAKSLVPGYGPTWTPTGAVRKQADCERGQASMEQQWSALVKLAPQPDLDKSVQWICLPDTVDPRAAKGTR